MTKKEKFDHQREVSHRFEALAKEYYTLVNLDNPFAKDVEHCENSTKEVLSFYKKFDGIRNSVQNEDLIQKRFENFLETGEEVVEKIKQTTESLSVSGEEYEKLEEARAIDFAKAIRTQVIKFKNWIKSSKDKMMKLKETLKEDISSIEKQIQKQLNFCSIK